MTSHQQCDREELDDQVTEGSVRGRTLGWLFSCLAFVFVSLSDHNKNFCT